MFENWYAILDEQYTKEYYNNYDEAYLITPIEFWNEHRYIPDCHTEFDLKGLDEISDHCFTANSKTNLTTKELLIKYGFKILDNPNWYYLDKDYPEKLHQQELKSENV